MMAIDRVRPDTLAALGRIPGLGANRIARSAKTCSRSSRVKHRVTSGHADHPRCDAMKRRDRIDERAAA
jgi:hypothetical protein